MYIRKSSLTPHYSPSNQFMLIIMSFILFMIFLWCFPYFLRNSAAHLKGICYIYASLLGIVMSKISI